MNTYLCLVTSLIVLLVLLVNSDASRLPRDTNTQLQQTLSSEDKAASEEVNSQSRRAMWLSTRELESQFKELIYMTLQELASEGRIDERVILPANRHKRGRYQGFCFQKTASGRYLPFICWKGERK